MVDYSDKWLGLAGAGFGFSVIGGVGVYQVNLFCMDGKPVPIRALVVGKRLGATLQAETAHAVCLMTGIRSADGMTEIKSNGVDWALSLGVKADSFLKSGSAVAKGLVELAVHSGNWAAHESAKKLVQGLMGDFELTPKAPSFILLPTPVALGIGAGIYYEWQTMSKVGTDLAWEYLKPQWRLADEGGRVLLKMKGIPEPDGAEFNFHIRENVWGADNLLRFAVPPRREGEHMLTGTVRNGMLCDPQMGLSDGFDLTSRVPVGKTTIGMLSVGKNAEVEKNADVSIGVSVCRGRINLYRWESDDYATVRSDGAGKFTRAVTAGWQD